MSDFAGVLFTLKKRVQNIDVDDSAFYKYMIWGFYDGLDIHTIDKWYDFRPKGLFERKLQVDLDRPYLDQYTIRALLPENREELDKQGFSYGFWEELGRAETKEFGNFEPELHKKYPFVCMSVINLTESFVKNSKNMQEMQESLVNIIIENAKELKYDLKALHCAIFPSMGYADFVVLFLTEDLIKTANMIGRLRSAVSEQKAVLSNCYSICGVDKAYLNEKINSTIDNMQISIRINFKEGVCACSFLDALKEELKTLHPDAAEKRELEYLIEEIEKSYYVTFGNADCLLLPTQTLGHYLNWHGAGQVLNPGSRFFQKNIANVRTSVRVEGKECHHEADSLNNDGKDLRHYQELFQDFIEKYNDFLTNHDMHIRSAVALQQVMKNFLSIAQPSHGFDVESILGEALLSLIQNMNYYIDKEFVEIDQTLPKEEQEAIKDKNKKTALEKVQAVESLEALKEYVGVLIADLIRSDRPFIERNAFISSSIGSATKLLFAYNEMLTSLTKRLKKDSEFAFVVSSGGCDRTEAIDVFSKSIEDKNIKKPIIIKIPEMSLYDIQGTMFRILHEYIHFIGNRRRKERYQHLVNAVAKYIGWNLSEADFNEERYNRYKNISFIHLDGRLKDEADQRLRAKYEEKKNEVRTEITGAFLDQEVFKEYARKSEEGAFFIRVLRETVLSVPSMVELFSTDTDDLMEEKDKSLKRELHKILYQADKAFIGEALEILEELKTNHPNQKLRLDMTGQYFNILKQAYEFQAKDPDYCDRMTQGLIDGYAEAMVSNAVFIREERGRELVWLTFDELREEIISAMTESFSDCGAVWTLGMRPEDFLLSFIYELWDIEHAQQLTARNILRLGADLKVAFGISGGLPKDLKEAIQRKAGLRKAQGYEYKNVEEMIKRVDQILAQYEWVRFEGIRGEIEAYLKASKKDSWYCKELGELYQSCDMETSHQLYQAVDRIFDQWKKIGGGAK